MSGTTMTVANAPFPDKQSITNFMKIYKDEFKYNAEDYKKVF
jgi:hypothetical protein